MRPAMRSSPSAWVNAGKLAERIERSAGLFDKQTGKPLSGRVVSCLGAELVRRVLRIVLAGLCTFGARSTWSLDSGSRESGHCWTVFRVPECFAGARLADCGFPLEAQACDLAFSSSSTPLPPVVCAPAPRSVQLRRKMSPNRSASRKSDQQWTFSREAERGFTFRFCESWSSSCFAACSSSWPHARGLRAKTEFAFYGARFGLVARRVLVLSVGFWLVGRRSFTMGAEVWLVVRGAQRARPALSTERRGL